MVKEFIKVRSKRTSITVTNSKVGALLKSDTLKTGLRLYGDGYLGIAGAIGAYDEDELYGKAKRMLDFKLPYDCEPTANITRHEDISGVLKLDEGQFFAETEKLLAKLSADYPRFMFSNKIELSEKEYSLENNRGLKLSQKDKFYSAEVAIKHRDSSNLFDGVGLLITRDYSFDKAYEEISKFCSCYDEKVDLGTEKIPVVMMERDAAFMLKFFSDLAAEPFANGASLFSGKTGQKLFSENFTLNVDRNITSGIGTTFFDGEGVILDGGSVSIIENGVIRAPYGTKKTAKRYGLPSTACADMIYDAAPAPTEWPLRPASCGKSLLDLLCGRKAVYVFLAGGGDFTPQGEYASPIQSAALYQDGKLLGRLPQISMSSNVFDMFGKDYIGRADGNGNDFGYTVIDMNVARIGDWM